MVRGRETCLPAPGEASGPHAPHPWLPAEGLTQWTSNFPTMTAGPKERAGFMEQPVK